MKIITKAVVDVDGVVVVVVVIVVVVVVVVVGKILAVRQLITR